MVLGQGERLVSGEEKSFFLGSLFCVASPSDIQNSLCIGKFLIFFFCKFDFSYFFCTFENSNINIDSMRKINDFKINALKVERVRKTFENLNSF